MTAKIIKDKHCRKFVFFEKQVLYDRFFSSSLLSKSFAFFKKNQHLVIIKNSCVFSKKSRIVFKQLKCSRNVLRRFGLCAFLCNFEK